MWKKVTSSLLGVNEVKNDSINKVKHATVYY